MEPCLCETISDQAIQTSHPIDLKPALIARVLSGMQVQQYLQYYQQTMAGEAITPVFSPEEVQFLAPRIAKALTTAGPGEAVAFLITSPRPGTREPGVHGNHCRFPLRL